MNVRIQVEEIDSTINTQSHATNETQPTIELLPVTPREALAEAKRKRADIDTRWKRQRDELSALLDERQKAVQNEKAMERYVRLLDSQQPRQPPAPRKSRAPVADQIRVLVAQKVLGGEMSATEATRVYNISASTVSRIVEAERLERRRNELALLPNPSEHVEPRPTKKQRGPKPKLDGDDIMAILDWLDDRPEMRLKDIVAQIAVHCHKTVTKSTVDRALQAVDITYKEMLPIPNKWNTDAVKMRRWQWVTSLLQENLGRPLVFVDEMPSNLHVRATHGRAPAGEPAKLSTLPKGHNVTLIAALSQSGIIYHKFVLSNTKGKRGTNADDFRLFLADLRRRLPSRAVVILDNAAIHHTDEVEADLKGLKELGFAYLFLPPYSPFMNPIEYAFSKIKKAVRQATFTNQHELQTAIAAALQTITSTDAAAWCEHIIRYYPTCYYTLPFVGKPLAPELSSDLRPVDERLQFEWCSFLHVLPPSHVTTTALIEGPSAAASVSS